MSSIYFKWPALESDPNIFNNYFHEIGLPEIYGFEELITLDYKELDCNLDELPIFGIIAAVSRKGIGYIDSKVVTGESIPFYIKQSKELDHACGLIAGLHCIGNNETIDLCESSILRNFFNMVHNKPEEAKTRILETYNDMKTKYTIYSQFGQTQAEQPENSELQPQQVKRIPIHHFISFCNIDDKLVELDGTLKGPIVLRNKIGSNELLASTVDEIRRRIHQGLIEDNISIMYLTYI
jgi:ubiquitin carboxyl-terminal hydrolase L3